VLHEKRNASAGSCAKAAKVEAKDRPMKNILFIFDEL
jgi:hypothetical protein